MPLVTLSGVNTYAKHDSASKAIILRILRNELAASDNFVTNKAQMRGKREMNAVPHQNSKYDWPKLADGKWRRWYQGKEFKCSPNSFRIQVYAAASRMGKTADTRCKTGESFVAFCICDK